jgi:cytoplasmic iron level regulating protein YaaA (DUF328/UPF0246 family)
MIILLHSSKTMRTMSDKARALRSPKFIKEATQLNTYMRGLNVDDIAQIMKIKTDLAKKTKDTIEKWSTNSSQQITALDAFLGDIYSGLQSSSLDKNDREYADTTLLILSGLYGIIRPLDGIMPYRLEMAYKLKGFSEPNLYKYWGSKLANTIPKDVPILNLSSIEYSKVITDFIDSTRVTTPKFLTVNPKTGQPTFVVVHAKIARGALARWAIKNRVENQEEYYTFTELGYRFNPNLSTAHMPVFVCKKFEGIGLSVRLR